MAEFQTAAAALDLAKLALAAAVFLKKVKNASKIAGEVCDRVCRLQAVLVGVEQVLQRRESLALQPSLTNENHQDASIVAEMWKALWACRDFLEELQREIGGFHVSEGSGEPTKALMDRFKIAWNHSRISHRQMDLEARISTLQTCLAVLHIFDQAHTQTIIDDNHKTLLHLLHGLNARIEESNRLQRMLLERTEESPSTTDETVHPGDQIDTEAAIKGLESCLRVAAEVSEHFSEHTSNAMPDEKSIRYHHRVVSGLPSLSSGIMTPRAESRSSSRINERTVHVDQSPPDPAVDQPDDVWPCELLDEHIIGYQERAAAEKEAGHFNQAESNLHRARTASDARERHYGVSCKDRSKMQEELAFLYGKQGKWAEAVSTIGQLMSGTGGPSDGDDRWTKDVTLARQNELLGSIYFEWHNSNTEKAPDSPATHIDEAEQYVRRAFIKRFHMIKSEDPAVTPSLRAEHERCMHLLVSILEQKGMTVEANDLKRRLSDEMSSSGNSLRRTSTIVSGSSATDGDGQRVEDPFQALIDAIDRGEAAIIQSLLDAEDIDVNRVSSSGKTPLMHAVERSDEPTVRRLLDPGIGGKVDFVNTKNASALHLAASQGLHLMVKCLLEHDAEIEAKDDRGATPLTKAVKGGHGTVIEYLSGEGANMMVKDTDEWSILHHAVYSTQPQIINLILHIHPDLRDAVDGAGKTALHHCAEQENLIHARLLLEHQRTALDVNASDEQDRSPLYFAASKPYTARRNELVALLLDHGAVFIASKRPPRWRDYPKLKTAMSPASPKGPAVERHDSGITSGTFDSAATSPTKLSGNFFKKMKR